KYSALPELQQVDIVISLNSIIRSCAHFSIFGLLGVLVALAFLPYKLNSHMRNVIAAAFCLFYAFSDEIHQLFVPGRAFQLFDILVDFCGSLCGIAFIYIIYIIKKKVQSKGSI
ncbi:MAG: VanZ family protein, partial [Oscillospiraceae bacterium]